MTINREVSSMRHPVDVHVGPGGSGYLAVDGRDDPASFGGNSWCHIPTDPEVRDR